MYAAPIAMKSMTVLFCGTDTRNWPYPLSSFRFFIMRICHINITKRLSVRQSKSDSKMGLVPM